MRYLQVCLDVASSGFNESGRCSTVSLNDNFVSNVVTKDVIIFREHVDGVEVEIEEVSCPGRVKTVNGTVRRKRQVNARAINEHVTR